ncbi:MAG: DUF4349 domain-containing protein [Halanaerobiales bacterium]
MKHEDYKELLPLYIDKGLNDKEKKLLETHLEECEECQKELKEYQQNYDFLSSLEKEKAPSGFSQSIMNKVNREMDGKIINEEKQHDNNDMSLLKRINNYFKKPLKIPAGVVGLAIIVLLIFISGIPASLLLENYRGEQHEMQQEITEDSADNDLYFSISESPQRAMPQEMKSEASENQMQNDGVQSEMDSLIQNESVSPEAEGPAEIERKIIQRANLTIETNNIEQINSQIMNLLQNYSGYISDSRNWVNYNNQKFSWYQLRIPTENFDLVLDEITSDKLGEVISRSVSGQDVTEEYLDLDIRINNLEAQEERYRELLNRADEVSEILKIENELNRVRTEIERLQGRINYLDNQVNYSTITVEFRQPQPISSGTPGIVKALRDAVNTMIRHFYRLITLIGTLIPYLLLLLLIYYLYKKVIRRRK